MYAKHKGYTLVEILLVATILVVLGLALLFGINPLQQIFKGYDARRRADLNKIKVALESYYSDHECYPQFPLEGTNPTYTCGSDILNPYLEAMPCDPNTKKPYTIYLVPANSTCPQQYSVYAQVYSFFDKNANDIVNCSDTIAVYSSGMSLGDINYGCSNIMPCKERYGCINGTCQKVSDNYESAPCSTAYCTNRCGNVNCSNPARACVAK